MEKLDVLKRIIENDFSKEQIDVMLKDVILANTKDVKLKFDIYDFCNKKGIYSYSTGVMHKDGFKMATNGSVAIKIKDTYVSEFENKVINKKGETVSCRYPDFETIRPKAWDLIDMDVNKVKQAIKESKLDKDVMHYVCLDGKYFSIPVIKLFVTFVEACNPNVIGIKSDFLYGQIDNGEYCVAMSMGKIESNGVIYQCN